MTKFILFFAAILLQFQIGQAQNSKLYHYGILGEDVLEIITLGDELCDLKFVYNSGLIGEVEYLPLSCEEVDGVGLEFVFEENNEIAKARMGMLSTAFYDMHFGMGLEGKNGDFSLKFALAGANSTFYAVWPSKGLKAEHFYATKTMPAFKILDQIPQQLFNPSQGTKFDFTVENFYLEEADKISLRIKGSLDPQTMTGELELEFSGAFKGKTKVKVGLI